ncbi:MAG: LCP family protein [Candidatus Saccharimonadales bacterium]
MKKKHSSLDGFIPRRPGDKLGALHLDGRQEASSDMPENKLLHTTGSDMVRALGDSDMGRGLGRSDIDESLKEIDEGLIPEKKLSRRQRRKMAKKLKRPRSLANRITRWVVLVLLIVLLGAGGYVGYKFFNASGNILQGSVFDIFNSKPLQQDSNGRSNFLILGTSEDDPGHGGAGLTDSILIISVDQNKKDAYIFSIPRDLYVQYGMACNAGYSGKINEYFSCVNSGTNAASEQDRLTKTQEFVGNIVGLNIQYSAHVNHTVIKEAVDAVGGVEVDVQGSNGAAGVLDRNFDWRCNYTCYLVKYDNGVYHLDGEHALFLSMARGDIAPTYGLANSNFDREKNQQKILIALKDKAMTTGILTNLSAVTNLIDALGNNLRTNIKTDEINTLMQVASNIKSSDVYTLSFVEEGNAIMATGNVGGASVVIPAAGIYEYGALKTYIQKSVSSDPVVRESAPIAVFNGTGKVGLGQSEADKLTNANYNVTYIATAPSGKYEAVEVYQIGTDNAGTAEALAKLFGVTIKTTTPPVTVDGETGFVIIFGSVPSSS